MPQMNQTAGQTKTEKNSNTQAIDKSKSDIASHTISATFRELNTNYDLELSPSELKDAETNINLPPPLRAAAYALNSHYSAVAEVEKGWVDKTIDRHDLSALTLPSTDEKFNREIGESFEKKMIELGAGAWLEGNASKLHDLRSVVVGTNFDVEVRSALGAQNDAMKFTLKTNEGFYKDLTEKELNAAIKWVNYGTPTLAVQTDKEGKIADVQVYSDHFAKEGSKSLAVAQRYMDEKLPLSKERLQSLEKEMREAIKVDILPFME